MTKKERKKERKNCWDERRQRKKKQKVGYI